MASETTIVTQLKRLPDKWRQKCIRYHVLHYKGRPEQRMGVNVSSLYGAIFYGFKWRSTTEGHDFWSRIASWVKEHDDDPTAFKWPSINNPERR